MTDEEAVKQFEKRNYNLRQHPTGANPVYKYRHDSEISRGDVAISAIRERIEREKGCEWCQDEIMFNGDDMELELQHPLEDTPRMIYPRFCPNCGRKL